MRIERRHKLLGVIWMFMFFFDISLKNTPTIISTRKIAFLLLLIEAIYSKIIIDRVDFDSLKWFFIVNTLIFLYLICITTVKGVWGHGGSIISRYCYFFLYTVFGSTLLISRYNSEYTFFQDIIGAMWIQSIIVFFEFFSPSFNVFLELHFSNFGNVAFFRIDRGTGLGAEGAALTLLLFLGVFSCNYVMLTKKVLFRYMIPQCIFMAAMFLVGRTGLYCSLILIVFTMSYMLFKKRNVQQAMKISVIIVLGITVSLFIMENIMTIEQYDRFINRILSVVANSFDDASVEALLDMEIPKVSMDTILGTGIYRGYASSGLLIWNDSGYIQMYAALGLIGALLFYAALLMFYKKIMGNALGFSEHTNTLLFAIYIVMQFIIEYKEPFSFKYMMPLFSAVSICLYHKRIRKEHYG